MWPYWLLTGLLVAVIVCLAVVAWQRDSAQMDGDAARAELAVYRARERRLTATGRCTTCGRP